MVAGIRGSCPDGSRLVSSDDVGHPLDVYKRQEQALTEAKRCLDCANPGCTEGCPVGIDIPRFIKNIERGEFLEAAKTCLLYTSRCV